MVPSDWSDRSDQSDGSDLFSADGGADDRRRAFPPPRRRWQAVRSRVFRRPGCRRHARSTERTYIIATPEAVAGCPLPTAPHIRQSGDESVKSERQRVPPRPLRSPRSPSYSPSLATDSGTPKRVLLLITTRHLRSCAGINNKEKNACQRYAPRTHNRK